MFTIKTFVTKMRFLEKKSFSMIDRVFWKEKDAFYYKKLKLTKNNNFNNVFCH